MPTPPNDALLAPVRRVLLADTDRPAATQASEILRAHGVMLGAVADPSAIGPAMERFGPSAVILGESMGLAAIHAVRADPRWSGLPVISLFRTFSGPLLLEALRAGAHTALHGALAAQANLQSLLVLFDRAARFTPLQGLQVALRVAKADAVLELPHEPSRRRFIFVAGRPFPSDGVVLVDAEVDRLLFEHGALLRPATEEERAIATAPAAAAPTAAPAAPGRQPAAGGVEGPPEGNGEYEVVRTAEGLEWVRKGSHPASPPEPVRDNRPASNRTQMFQPVVLPPQAAAAPVPPPAQRTAPPPMQQQQQRPDWLAEQNAHPTELQFDLTDDELSGLELQVDGPMESRPIAGAGDFIDAGFSRAAGSTAAQPPPAPVATAPRGPTPPPMPTSASQPLYAPPPGSPASQKTVAPPRGNTNAGVSLTESGVIAATHQAQFPQAPPGQRGRALVVDDDPVLSRMVALVLARAGFEVTTAVDGLDGHAQAAVARPDVALVDLDMPRLDGWGLLSRLRADPRLFDVPVLFFSAHDDYLQGLSAIEAGARDYLRKGMRLEEIARRVVDAVAPRAQARERIAQGLGLNARIERIGPVWLLRELLSRQISGTLSIADGVRVVNIGLSRGTVVNAVALENNERLDGRTALLIAFGFQSGDLQFHPRSVPLSSTLAPVDAAQLDALAVEALRQAEGHRLRQLLGASSLEIDAAAARIHLAQVGEPGAEPMLLALAAGGSPAQAVVPGGDAAVQMLRDLHRRGIVRVPGERRPPPQRSNQAAPRPRSATVGIHTVR